MIYWWSDRNSARLFGVFHVLYGVIEIWLNLENYLEIIFEVPGIIVGYHSYNMS